MKQQISLAALLLISSSRANKTPDGHPVYPQSYHFNEDPHSVPDPLAGKQYMTATQAKYHRKDTWDTQTEDASMHPNFFGQHNAKATQPEASNSWMTKYWGKEPLDLQTKQDLKNKADSDSDSDSSDSDSDDEQPNNNQNIQWKQTPDLGELDDHATLYREFDQDYEIGKAKFSGWTNPLGWKDDGNDDDLVLVQLTPNGLVERRITDKMMLQYEEAEGPTKVDLSDSDQHVVEREADNGYLVGKSKFHGWTNPLGWTDNGEDDSSVLVQLTPNGPVERRITEKMLLQYEEAEGPTKVDLSDCDQHVIGREADNDYLVGKAKFHGWTNPLGWTDDGEDDDKILGRH